MALETILVNEFAVRIVYPFLLVFTLIFAILEKSRILGEGKRQIDALIALSIGLIVVAFSWATNIISNLMPFLAISVVVILVFIILYGFVASGKEGLEIPKNLKIGIGVLAAIVTIIALIVATGQWDYVVNSLFVNGQPTGLAANILIIAIIVGALVIVLFTGKDKAKT